MSFSIPTDIVGSFSFDENPKEENKLINIEARENQWIIYSTSNVNIIVNNNITPSTPLTLNSFYILRRNEKNYLIYVSSLVLGNTEAYQYNTDLNLNIGNDGSANIQYQCPLLENLKVKISNDNNQIVLENINRVNGVYINNIASPGERYNIKIGDQINIYGLKIIILNKLLLINNPGKNLIIMPTTNIQQYIFMKEECKNIEVEEISLYNQNDYFSKSPRIRRNIQSNSYSRSYVNNGSNFCNNVN